jgi:asparagine synthase (glutamine-hydrolysing)
MCGIVGIHAPRDSASIDGWIEAMNATQFHRGPDDAGIHRDRNAGLALAMRRLAILDIAGGRQPMHSEDGRYTLVYNGEIYNAEPLRRELEAAGEIFTTHHSDTEVLLRLLIREGANCLPRLNGMFAFAFYDRERRTLLAARDRFGIKPFYYYAGAGRFAFASELKSLLQLPFVSRDIDRQALFDYLSLMYVPGEQSILSSIRRLPPGHWLEYRLDDGTIRTARWWQLRFRPDRSVAPADWPELIRDALANAVVAWSRSDVPVAVSLSGGLDSSAIAALAAKSGMNVSAHSLGFAGPGEAAWDELPLARKVAGMWGLEHHEVVLRPEAMIDTLPAMVHALDEPYGGGLPSWFVFAGMSQSVKVGLTGTGGDEMFGNYGKWRRLERRGWLAQLFASPGQVSAERFRRSFFERFYYFSDAAKRAVLVDGGADCLDTSDRLHARFRDTEAASLRDGVAGLDIGTQLADEFLLMTDRFSMAHSLEARTPFLDNDLVDLVARIPARIRTRRDDLKGLLREAVAPLLPPELLRAPKRGFVIPLGAWMRGRLRPTVERLLAPERLREQGLLSPAFHESYVRPHLEGRADHTPRVWGALMFELWHRSCIERAGPEAITIA